MNTLRVPQWLLEDNVMATSSSRQTDLFQTIKPSLRLKKTPFGLLLGFLKSSLRHIQDDFKIISKTTLRQPNSTQFFFTSDTLERLIEDFFMTI